MKLLAPIALSLFSTTLLAMPWQVRGEFKLGMENQKGYYSKFEGDRQYDLNLNFKKTMSLSRDISITPKLQWTRDYFPDANPEALGTDKYQDQYRVELGFNF